MKEGVVLRKTAVSRAFRKRLRDYYGSVEAGASYAGKRVERITGDGAIVVYRASKAARPIGWLVYNPGTSMIEEIVTERPGWEQGSAEEMIDALIARETLVSAEVLKADREKYNGLLAYGFRPTGESSFHGFTVTKMDLSTAVLFERLPPGLQVKPYGKKEHVAIERVPGSQTYEEIRKGLERLIHKLGGVGRFVKPGQSVVIKPNVVSDHGMKEGVYKGGIVTDVRLIRALVELFLPVAGRVVVAEGSSINRSETTKMFALYGYDRLVDIDPARVSLVDLNNDDQVEKRVPGGKRMLARKIPRTLEEADVIISVPVLKVHFAAVASLAVKHLQGAVPPLEKYMTHFFGLWQNLVNIHHLVKPRLTIIDGLTGQEDFGPVSGVPKKMDLLIGGSNPVAVDAVAMRVMGMDPLSSPPVRLAWLQGLGPLEEDRIEVIGPSIEEVKDPFKQPEINLSGGRDITIHADRACSGCRGYLHFVLMKLRKPDPLDPSRNLIDRPFTKKVNIYLGPGTGYAIDPGAENIFLGICRQQHAGEGVHLPGCPPHAEVLVNGIFSLFPDVEKPKYADESEEKKLGEMLGQILAMSPATSA
jgi:uncharacterized protein (DUF362 family)